MTAEEDAKRQRAADKADDAPDDAEGTPPAAADEPRAPFGPLAMSGAEAAAIEARDGDDAERDAVQRDDAEYDVSPVAPTQLGARRFVFAAYFAAGIFIAFLMSKVLDAGWLKLQNYKPVIGDPRDEVIMPLSGLIGGGAAVYYWYRTRARQLAEEVAAEMSKVTWPSRTEVTNGTVVVIVTTLVSTVFFALMDKFWGFITNLVYGGT
jgi:preprotein translocase subunit SecE